MMTIGWAWPLRSAAHKSQKKRNERATITAQERAEMQRTADELRRQLAHAQNEAGGLAVERHRRLYQEAFRNKLRGFDRCVEATSIADAAAWWAIRRPQLAGEDGGQGGSPGGEAGGGHTSHDRGGRPQAGLQWGADEARVAGGVDGGGVPLFGQTTREKVASEWLADKMHEAGIAGSGVLRVLMQ